MNVEMLNSVVPYHDIELVKWLIATVGSPQRFVMAKTPQQKNVLDLISFLDPESVILSIAELILQQGVPAARLVLSRDDDHKSPMIYAVKYGYHDLAALSRRRCRTERLDVEAGDR